MRVWTALLGAVAWLGTAAPAGAETPVVGWAEVASLLREHPATRLADREVDAAAGRRLASRGWDDPEIALGVGHAWAHEGSEQRATWEIEGELALPFPGVLAGRATAADAALAAAHADGAQRWRDTCWRAHAMLLELARDERAEALWRGAAGQAEELVRLVGVRIDSGEDRPLQRYRARTEAERVRMGEDRARLHTALHRDGLRTWLGGGLPEQFSVAASLDVAPPPVTRDQLRVAMTDGDPRLHAATLSVDRSRGERVEAAGEVAPELWVGGGYGEELDARGVHGAVGLSLPLLSPGTGALAEARAGERAAAEELEIVRRELALEADEAWMAWAGADAAAARFRDGILPSAVAAVDALTVAYDAGEVSLLELLDARRVLLDVQLEALDVDLERALAAARIRILTGEFDDER